MTGYVELHCHSAFSFGDGASDPEELAAAAAKRGHEALALTDHDNVCGAMEFARACKRQGVRPIVGAEITVGTAHLTLLVESAEGWRNLCTLITEAHQGTRPKERSEPPPPSLSLEALEGASEGLVCLSGCAGEGAAAGRWERGDPRGAEAIARRLLGTFGSDRFRIELQRPLWRRDRARNRWLAGLGERLGVACVATGNAHAHERSRAALQDALVAIRLRATLDETEPLRRGNSASVLLSNAEAAARFRDHPRALAESVELADRLRFDLTQDLGYSYPQEAGADRRLAELCRARLEERYGAGARDHAGARIPPAERAQAEQRLGEELGLIRDLDLSGFFLLHHDMLELAAKVAAEVRAPRSPRSGLPPGRGRGSSVSSIVCYLTGLSHIDPVRNRLSLGRFLNEELTQAPDIDLDFPREVREKLIPRVHERYGRRHSALVAAFSTYRTRGAVRDLGRALGLPAGEVERLARTADLHEASRDGPARFDEVLGRLRARSPRWRALAELIGEISGLPRHISQHSGGMVISTQPLVELCPVQPAAMEGRQIVQWDKDSCADARFLKIDLLGLGMLSAVERCVEEIARSRDERVDLSRIPLDDEECWGAIRRAETTGVFQIESRAQMQMLPRTLPRDLDDLTVQVALVRPGPIQGGAVHPYIERRRRLREDPSYEPPCEHPRLREVLRDTLGAIVFQDQVLEVAIELAGFSIGEAEELRRAMSRKRSEEAIQGHRERFIEGATERGVAPEVAERVFGQIEGFSGFGFPKSHSAAFGLLAYQSTWLRVHYGPEFLCSLLNEQPMGFYPPDSLVHEAQRRGIQVLPPDVNSSAVDCEVQRLEVRIGLGYVGGVKAEEVEALVAERERGGAYRDIAELASRSGAGRAALERLAWAGACDRLTDHPPGVAKPSAAQPRRLGGEAKDVRVDAGPEQRRRPALWAAGATSFATRSGDATQLALPLDGAPAPALPDLSEWDRLIADYRSTGMTLDRHPMALLRERLALDTSSSRELPRRGDGSLIRVAGMVVARQRPATAKGVVFMLLEDEWGTINLIIPPPVAERHRVAVRTSGFVLACGRLEHREGTTNVLLAEIERLEHRDLRTAEVREISAPAENETGRGQLAVAGGGRGAIVAELAAALPAGHSFGRRGR